MSPELVAILTIGLLIVGNFYLDARRRHAAPKSVQGTLEDLDARVMHLEKRTGGIGDFDNRLEKLEHLFGIHERRFESQRNGLNQLEKAVQVVETEIRSLDVAVDEAKKGAERANSQLALARFARKKA